MAVYADRAGINCHSCPTAYKIQRGCLSEIPGYRLTGIGIDDEILTRCPRFPTGGRELVLISAYREYKNGFLPNAGGWLDQPMLFGDAMQTIDFVMAKLDEKENGDKR